MKIETRAVHAGRHIDPATGAVTAADPPFHHVRTQSGGRVPAAGTATRGRTIRTATTWKSAWPSLEGGTAGAVLLPAAWRWLPRLVQGLEPGDHVVAPDDVYWGLRKVIGEVFGKWGLETSYVDMTDIDDFHAALRAEHAAGVGGNALESTDEDHGPDGDCGAFAPEPGPTSLRSATARSRRRCCSVRSIAASTWWRIRRRSTWAGTAT